MKIAILSGCLGGGFRLVPINSLYHRVMVRELRERYGIKARVHLGRLVSNSPADHLDEARLAIRKHAPDLLIYQVRPGFLWSLLVPVWIRLHGFSILRLRPNPCMIYGAQWPVGLRQEWVAMSSRLRNQNLMLSRLSGWHWRARRLFGELLHDVRAECRQAGVRMMVLEPLYPPGFASDLRPMTEKFVSRVVADLEVASIVPHALPWHDEPESWLPDGFHLTAAAHTRLGEFTAETLARGCGDVSGDSGGAVSPGD